MGSNFTMSNTAHKPSKKIIPLILCGGSGKRLWPLSRWNKPKQFIRFYGDHSLYESTLLRCRSAVFDERPIIVGAESHRRILNDSARNLGIDADFVLEPDRRDSCAAILAGLFVAAKRDPEALVMVMAADHSIPDGVAFAAAAEQAVVAATLGKLVTFGVKPLSPATGYGYILKGARFRKSKIHEVSRFVEKPDLETAKFYLKEGYLWNSGNFMFLAKTVLDEAMKLTPQIYAAVAIAVDRACHEDSNIFLEKLTFEKSPRISFDYAILERSDRAVVLPVGYAWSDVGSWDAVASMVEKNAQSNSHLGRALIEESRDVFVHSENLLTIVIGCSNISVITTPSSVLVVGKGMSEKVKDMAVLLDEENEA